MSTIVNHITLVHDYDERLVELRNKAIEIFDPLIKERSNMKTDGEFISSIFTSVTNDEEFFIISTDGSKNGWETNTEFEQSRAEFIKFCDKFGAIQVATVEFGENDKPVITDVIS